MSASPQQTLKVGNANNIFVRDLRDPITKAYDNTAVLTFTLKDSSDANVSGAVGISMPYIAASDGHYSGILPGTVSLTHGQTYTAVVTDNANSLRWEIPLIAETRTE